MNLSQTYDQIAEDWHADHATDQWWLVPGQRFLAKLKPGSSILDVGCGPGVKAAYFSKRGMHVLGIDISQKLLDIAKREASKAEFRLLDMREAGQVGQKFDGVFAQASLLHIPKEDIPSVVRTLKEQLLPGGIMYIGVKERRAGQPEEQMVVEDDYGYQYERFFSFFTLDEIINTMKEAGMNIVHQEVATAGKTNWIDVIGQVPLSAA